MRMILLTQKSRSGNLNKANYDAVGLNINYPFTCSKSSTLEISLLELATTTYELVS